MSDAQGYKMTRYIIIYLVHFAGVGIQHIDSIIFRANPNTAVIIFRQSADTLGIQGISVTSGDVFIKRKTMIRQIIDPTEHCSDPNTSLSILIN